MVYDIKSNSLVSWSQYLKENRCSSSLQLNLKKMMGLWNIVYICMHAFSSLLHPDVLHSRMKLLFAVGKSLLFRRYSLFFFSIFAFFHSLSGMFSISHLKASLWERPENGNISVAISFLYDLNKSWGKKSFFARCKS